jgi:AraC-like DNA-binding protein
VIARRSVDWTFILGQNAPAPRLVKKGGPSDHASLLAGFHLLFAGDDIDAILRRAFDIVRFRIGLERVGLFLIDDSAPKMLGTWGSDLKGDLVDEHHIMFDLTDGVLDVFRRAETEGEQFTVLENCPIVVQRRHSTEVVGQNWVACTPIRSERGPIGMMFNDVGLSDAPVDEAKQVRASLFCLLLGGIIEHAKARPRAAPFAPRSPLKHPAVRRAVEMLDGDPSLVGKEMASSLDISLSQLLRLFKAELGVSLVEYRNRLRLERFEALVGDGGHNYLAAAQAAGFGSYAQFHRVFRSAHGSPPRKYLRRG